MGDNPTPAEKLTPAGCSRVDRIHGDGPRNGADAGNETAEASPSSCLCFMTLRPSAYGKHLLVIATLCATLLPPRSVGRRYSAAAPKARIG